MATRIVFAVCTCWVIAMWLLLAIVPQAHAVSCTGCSIGNGQTVDSIPASGSISFRFTNNVAATDNGTFSHNQRCFYITSSDGGEIPAFHVWSEYIQSGAPTGGDDSLGARRVLYLDIDSPLTPGCTYTIGCRGLWSLGSHDESLASTDYSVIVKVAEVKEPSSGDGSGNGSGDGLGDGFDDGGGNGVGGSAGTGMDSADRDGKDETPSESPIDSSADSQTDGTYDQTDITDDQADNQSIASSVSRRMQELDFSTSESQQVSVVATSGRVYKIFGQIGGGGGGSQGAFSDAADENITLANLFPLLPLLAFVAGALRRQVWFCHQHAAFSDGEKGTHESR